MHVERIATGARLAWDFSFDLAAEASMYVRTPHGYHTRRRQLIRSPSIDPNSKLPGDKLRSSPLEEVLNFERLERAQFDGD